MYELTSYGNRETGEAHYLVDGVEVTKSEYEQCLAEYNQAKEGSAMKEYTTEQRKAEARSLDTKDLIRLAKGYANPTPGTDEQVCSDILNAEVERRILAWEIAEV